MRDAAHPHVSPQVSSDKLRRTRDNTWLATIAHTQPQRAAGSDAITLLQPHGSRVAGSSARRAAGPAKPTHAGCSLGELLCSTWVAPSQRVVLVGRVWTWLHREGEQSIQHLIAEIDPGLRDSQTAEPYAGAEVAPTWLTAAWTPVRVDAVVGLHKPRPPPADWACLPPHSPNDRSAASARHQSTGTFAAEGCMRRRCDPLGGALLLCSSDAKAVGSVHVLLVFSLGLKLLALRPL